MRGRRHLIDLALMAAMAVVSTFFYGWIAYLAIKDELPPSFWDLWFRWDTQHYVYIASIGYERAGEGSLRIVFFPFYPMLVRAFSYLIPHPIAASLVVANLAYVALVFVLYRLARLDGSARMAWGATIALTVFPTSYFLHLGYTESIFLLLVVFAFYQARLGRWWLAGLAGMLAAATRVTGVLLLPALLIEYFTQRGYRLREARPGVLWLALIPLGLVFYLWINQLALGDPLAFLAIQRQHWAKQMSSPGTGLEDAWSCHAWASPASLITRCSPELLAGVTGYLVAAYAWIRLRPSYGAFALLVWLVSTSTGYWQSLPRYLLSLFPLYIGLGRIGRQRGAAAALVYLALLLQGLFLALFVIGRWAF